MQLQITFYEKIILSLILFLGLTLVAGVVYVEKVSAQVSCDDSVGWRTEPSSDGKYKLTAFGCSQGYSDPNDNCIPAGGNPPEYCEAGLSGPECERKLQWFAANMGIFGKWKKLLVTNEATGKSVVVITIDLGPACWVERDHGPVLDVSYDAAVYLGNGGGGNYEIVTAQPVPDDTPIGPTDGSGIQTNPTSGTGSGSRTATSCWVTAVGSPNEDDKPVCQTSSSGGPGGPCQIAPAPPSDVKQAIIDKWGITLNLPQNQIDLAWEEFHEIDCTGFLQDIQGTVVGSWGNEYAQQFNCPGQGGSQVMFSSNWSGEFMKAILVHELTHVWQFCSEKGEANRIANGSAFGEEGGVTNYSRTGCGFDVSLLNEDHADTIALYLNPEQGELTCGGGRPNPFAGGGFPIHRGVAEQGVPKQNSSPQAPVGVGPQP